MKTEDTNLPLLTSSAFWSSSWWPLATEMSSRRQRSIPLGGRFWQVSLYDLLRPICYKLYNWNKLIKKTNVLRYDTSSIDKMRSWSIRLKISALNFKNVIPKLVQVNAIEHLWWYVNIGLCNGLVASCNKPLPEPMLTQICDTIWHR